MFHTPHVSMCVRSAVLDTPRGTAPSDMRTAHHSIKIDALGFELPSLRSWQQRPVALPLSTGVADIWNSVFVKPNHFPSGNLISTS